MLISTESIYIYCEDLVAVCVYEKLTNAIYIMYKNCIPFLLLFWEASTESASTLSFFINLLLHEHTMSHLSVCLTCSLL